MKKLIISLIILCQGLTIAAMEDPFRSFKGVSQRSLPTSAHNYGWTSQQKQTKRLNDASEPKGEEIRSALVSFKTLVLQRCMANKQQLRYPLFDLHQDFQSLQALAQVECLPLWNVEIEVYSPVVFSPDNNYCAFRCNQALHVRYINSGSCSMILSKSKGYGRRTMAFSPDGNYIATMKDGHQKIKIWNLCTGNCVKKLKQGIGHNDTLLFSPDSNYLITDSGQHTQLWDWNLGICIRKFKHSKNYSRTELAFSDDGHYLISSSENEVIKIWEVSSGRCVKKLKSPYSRAHEFHSIPLSQDGHYAAQAIDKTIYVWNTETAQCMKAFAVKHPVRAIVFSADNKYLAVTFRGKAINALHIYDIESENCEVELLADTTIESCRFSPDSKHFSLLLDKKMMILYTLAQGVKLTTSEEAAQEMNRSSGTAKKDILKQDKANPIQKKTIRIKQLETEKRADEHADRGSNDEYFEEGSLQGNIILGLLVALENRLFGKK